MLNLKLELKVKFTERHRLKRKALSSHVIGLFGIGVSIMEVLCNIAHTSKPKLGSSDCDFKENRMKDGKDGPMHLVDEPLPSQHLAWPSREPSEYNYKNYTPAD